MIRPQTAAATVGRAAARLAPDNGGRVINLAVVMEYSDEDDVASVREVMVETGPLGNC